MFHDRADGGQQLAERLSQYAGRKDVIVLGIPRGGVPVAFEVAQALGVPLDILLVRKLGTPGQRELAMGAIASGGVRILNEDVVRELGITQADVESAVREQQVELQRREEYFRGSRTAVSVEGKTVIVVDDGIATGSSMLAAIEALRTLHPGRIVVATPVAPPQVRARMLKSADGFVTVHTPERFFAIGEFYEDFSQTEDSEVRDLLRRAAASPATAQGAA